MKKLIPFTSLFLFALITFSQTNEEKSADNDEKPKAEKKEESYSDIINDKAITSNGLFDVHKIDDKYYYEINDSLLGRDMMMVTRVVKMATELPLRAHKLSEQVLRWEKFENNILLRVASYANFANDSLPIKEAVSNSNFEPIIASFKIKTKNIFDFLAPRI